MGTTKRNDLHKPSAAEYGDYEFLANFYLGSGGEEFADYFAMLCESDPMTWEDAKEKYPSFAGNFDRKETCDHCGARFSWGCAYLHKPSGELVHVGHTCASKSFEYPSRAAAVKAKASKKLAKLRKYARLTAERNEKFWAENPDLDKAALAKALDTDHYISRDLKASFEKWGNLSAKQLALVFKLEADVAKKAAEAAAEAANPRVKEPVPETSERITVTGKLISYRWEKNRYAYAGEDTLKMLVEDDRGFRLWGTMPSSLGDAERGDRVTFCAAVTRSKKDEFFGFTKRPTKGKILTVANPPAADEAEAA
jgi:hypothetical protein